MRDPLQALQVIFTDIWANGLVWDAREKLRSRVDSACYTYELRLLASIEANPDLLRDNQALIAAAAAVREGVIEDLKHDAAIASRQFWLKLMRAIVMPPFKKLVVPACKELIDPLADLIPDLLKEIINPHKTFEQVMNAIIDSSILTVIGE